MVILKEEEVEVDLAALLEELEAALEVEVEEELVEELDVDGPSQILPPHKASTHTVVQLRLTPQAQLLVVKKPWEEPWVLLPS